MRKHLLVVLLLSVHILVRGQGMKALQISTTENDKWHVYPAAVIENDSNPMRIKFLSSDVNTIFRSFGTCFNELDWYALQLLPKEEQDKFFYNFFDPEGDLRFTIGRIPMGASDYAAPENFYTELYHEREEGIDIWNAWYSPDEMSKGQQDLNMEHFTLERDRKAIIPFIKRAMEVNPDLTFWCSPWSPPQWMKKSEHYSNRAGYGNGLDVTYPRYTTQFKMEDAILKAYAMYFSRFITEYGKEGIPITGCCYQNEAYTVNYYPNTSWSAEDAGRFNADYLIPYLNKHNPGVKVWLGTLNTADVNNIQTILNTVSTAQGYEGKRLYEMVAGAGFQWEGRDAIATIRKNYPSLEMLQTESECGGGTFDWPAGVHTFELIHHYLNNGCVDYTNWNSILAGNGRGPFMNWHQNAIVHINEIMPRANGTCTAYYTPEYYAYKHYSHFLCKGTKILNKPVAKELLLVAQRPDGLYVAVVGNEGSQERSLKLDIDGHCINVNVPAHSMNTFVVGSGERIDKLAEEEGMKEGEEEYPYDDTHNVYIDPTQKYYLYNIKEGKYLNAGGRFGTRPVLDDIGCEYTLEYADSGDDYYLSTPYGENTYLGYTEVGGGLSLEQKYFMDNSKVKERLTFYPASESNVYAIGIYGSYFVYKTSLSIGELNDGELGYGQKISEGDNINEIDGCLWKLVTAEERWAEALEASENAPADVTFDYIMNPDFNRLHNGDDRWSVQPLSTGVTTDPYREYIGEFVNTKGLDSYIELTEMPAGVYEFSLYGFVHNDDNSPSVTSIYATGDNGDTVASLLPASTSGSNEGKLGYGQEREVSGSAGWYVPADAEAAIYYFDKGNYERTSVRVTVKDGKLQIGFKTAEGSTDNWVAFDNLRLKYYPCGDDAALNIEYLERLNVMIEKARQLLQGATVGADALGDAINKAQKVYNDQPAWNVSQKAIFELEKAIELFNSFQNSDIIKDKIIKNNGDASFLLPHITQWNAENANILRNSTTDENWDGKKNSDVGLVKLYSGELSTTLSGMPAGTYRMVAAVRGGRNNRAVASVNDNDEASVILPGWNLDEVGSEPIINKNGVQMPVPAGNVGYNEGYNSKGWCWLSAEGTLEETGELSMKIYGTSGEVQISNVCLYYLTGNTIVNVVEGKKLYNKDKTVSCDICLLNPNAIIESEDTIITSAGESLNNNLVNNEISKLVLFDGYAYTPVDATVGNLEFYCNLPAEKWMCLCLPFVPVESISYYQPVSLMDDELILNEMQTGILANTPYFVRSSCDISMFTASDVILEEPLSLKNTESSLITINGTYTSFSGPFSYKDYYLNDNSLVCSDTDFNILPFRAWVTMNEDTGLDFISLTIDDETSVKEITGNETKVKKGIYDLSGRRLNTDVHKKGIYIMDGKKVVY